MIPQPNPDLKLLSGETLVIIPTYNERENISEVLRRVLGQPVPLHVLIVDDNSPDGTAKLVSQLADSDPRIQLLQRPGKAGLGTAYIAGFRYALEHGYRYILEMDADLSHDPDDLPRFLNKIQDAHLVVGSRYVGGVNVVNWPLSRLMLSYGASMYARVVTGLPLRDTTAGFKCFRREVLETIDLSHVKAGGYGFQIEMHWRVWMAGFKIVEMPIVFTDRTVGKSKMSKAIVREAIFLVLKLGLAGFFKRWKLKANGAFRPLN